MAKCSCNFCTVDYPKIREIEAQLTGQQKKDFDYFMSRLMCAENERDAAEAKLAGAWTGFEWMKEEMKKHGYK